MKKKLLFPALSLMAMLIISSSIFSQNYDSGFFPLGVWSVKGDFRGVDEFLFDVDAAAALHHTSFANLKAEGFNAVFLSYDPITITLDTILDIAEMNDMKVIQSTQNLHALIEGSNDYEVTDQDIYDALEMDSIQLSVQSPATLGYYLYDEPLPDWFDWDVMARARDILEDVTGGNHPILSVWNDERWMEDLDNTIPLDVLMMDTYPLEDGDAPGDLSDCFPAYFSWDPDPIPYADYIDLVRKKHCDAKNKPLWVVLQAFGDLETPENGGYWRQVYPKEIRLQVYLAVMQGAKGIWYFLYESEFPYLLGMLDVAGQPTDRLHEAEAVNAEISAVSDLLLRLQVVTDSTAALADNGAVRMHVDTTTANGDKYVIPVNTDISETQEVSVTVKKSVIGYEVNSVQDVSTGEIIAFDENEDMISFTLPVDAGSGRFIRLSDEVVDVKKIEKQQQIRVYPNPATDVIHVVHDFVNIHTYSISDLAGREVETGILAGEEIDVSRLQPGTYFVTLHGDGDTFTQRVVKE